MPLFSIGASENQGRLLSTGSVSTSYGKRVWSNYTSRTYHRTISMDKRLNLSAVPFCCGEYATVLLIVSHAQYCEFSYKNLRFIRHCVSRTMPDRRIDRSVHVRVNHIHDTSRTLPSSVERFAGMIALHQARQLDQPPKLAPMPFTHGSHRFYPASCPCLPPCSFPRVSCDWCDTFGASKVQSREYCSIVHDMIG